MTFLDDIMSKYKEPDPLYKRLNDLVSINGRSMQLQILSCRYGGYFVAFLAESEEAAYNTADQFSSGDEDYMTTENHFLHNDWYPLVTGDNVQEAMNKLAEKINSIPEEKFEDWKTAVTVASSLFSQVVYKDDLFSLRDKPLPNFDEYIAWLKQETYL